MPEQRARKYHQDRVAETMREEIDAMILGDLSDPRILSSHVTQVVLNPGGKSAEVFVQVDEGTPEAENSTIDGLMAARGYIRVELKSRMGKRHVPDLTFHADRSDRMANRIDELLTRTRKRSKTKGEPASAANPAEPQSAAKQPGEPN
jgi:ribosome-binding factor A